MSCAASRTTARAFQRWTRISPGRRPRVRKDSSTPLLIEQPTGMACDHQVLVSGDHPRRHTGAGTRNAWAAFGIGLLVQGDAKPMRFPTGPRPDLGRVFANSCGEHERVETSQRRGKGAEFASN